MSRGLSDDVFPFTLCWYSPLLHSRSADLSPPCFLGIVVDPVEVLMNTLKKTFWKEQCESDNFEWNGEPRKRTVYVGKEYHDDVGESTTYVKHTPLIQVS